jgi:hypothetical protein
MPRKIDQPLSKLLESPYDVMLAWASQLGVDWAKVISKAGVSDSNLRAYRKRMKEGDAPEVREALYDVLAQIEQQRKAPTEIGSVMCGLREWAELGERLAKADPTDFLERLAAARRLVALAEESVRADAAFGSIK